MSGHEELAEREGEEKENLQTNHLGWVGVGTAVLVAFLWSLCYPLITTAVHYAPPFVVAALRSVVAGGVLLSLTMFLDAPHPSGWNWGAVTAIGICSTGIGFTGMFYAGGKITPGLATVIANVQPILAAVIGYFILEESLHLGQGLGMGIAFTGIIVVSSSTLLANSTLPSSGSGILFVLLGAAGVAAGNVLMKRYSDVLHPITATGWQLLFGASVLFLLTFLDNSVGFSRTEWTWTFLFSLLGLSIPGTAIAFALWFWLMRRGPLNTLNVFSFLTPIFAFTIGMMFYQEHPSVREIVGSILVMIGAWLATQNK
jgi:drug/metabolite transporter (DMT)-like permease